VYGNVDFYSTVGKTVFGSSIFGSVHFKKTSGDMTLNGTLYGYMRFDGDAGFLTVTGDIRDSGRMDIYGSSRGATVKGSLDNGYLNFDHADATTGHVLVKGDVRNNGFVYIRGASKSVTVRGSLDTNGWVETDGPTEYIRVRGDIKNYGWLGTYDSIRRVVVEGSLFNRGGMDVCAGIGKIIVKGDLWNNGYVDAYGDVGRIVVGDVRESSGLWIGNGIFDRLGSLTIKGDMAGCLSIDATVGTITMGHLRGDMFVDGPATIKTRSTFSPIQGSPQAGNWVNGQLWMSDGARPENALDPDAKAFTTLVTPAGTFKVNNAMTLYPVVNGEYELATWGGYMFGGSDHAFFATHSDRPDATSVKREVQMNSGIVTTSYVVGGETMFTMSTDLNSRSLVQTGWFLHTDVADFDLAFGHLALPVLMDTGKTYTVTSTALGDVTLPDGTTTRLLNGAATLSATVLGFEMVNTSQGMTMALKVQYDLRVTGTVNGGDLSGPITLTSTQTAWVSPSRGDMVAMTGGYSVTGLSKTPLTRGTYTMDLAL